MRKQIFATIVIAMALGVGPTAFASSPEELHKVADSNKDGALDRKEYQGRQVDLFYFHDRDKDGALVAGEADLTPERVKAADRNGDGKLQLKEFLDARSIDFRAADKNGDGSLSVSEVSAAP